VTAVCASYFRMQRTQVGESRRCALHRLCSSALDVGTRSMDVQQGVNAYLHGRSPTRKLPRKCPASSLVLWPALGRRRRSGRGRGCARSCGQSSSTIRKPSIPASHRVPALAPGGSRDHPVLDGAVRCRHDMDARWAQPHPHRKLIYVYIVSCTTCSALAPFPNQFLHPSTIGTPC
jgi:hypothetical protein